MALRARCGEEITLANTLDPGWRCRSAPLGGEPRSLTTTHWRIFMLLYRHRGDVVYNDRIHVELSGNRDRPSAELIREHMRKLRKVLTGSRYQILNYRSLGYELIVADAPDAPAGRLPETRRRRLTGGGSDIENG